MTIIPAIDIIEGKCVRLTQGDYAQVKMYNENPLEVAQQFQDIGLHRLHLVDLDGAKAGAVKNWKVLEQLAGKTSLIIDFGGGIKSAKDVEIVFNSGAAIATVGSMAVKEEALFKMLLQHFGAGKFLLGADVNKEKIVVSGWVEQTDMYAVDFIHNYLEAGVQQFFCTDIAKDGMLEGPATELYKKLIGEIENLQLIASGGVSKMQDVDELQKIGCTGVIIGKAIYENRITITELKQFISRNRSTENAILSERKIDKIPVMEIWDSISVIKAERSKYLLKDDIIQLLQNQKVQFIIADAGNKPEWINPEECFIFWKSVARHHISENYNEIALNDFPDAYAFIASQWISNQPLPIILLEKCIKIVS